jgi:predicted nuclease of restriction endonuclease-like RecB superfamily
MLTREFAITEYKSGQIIPDRLTRKSHAHYVGLIDRALNVYRNGVGRTRCELHRSVQHLFAEELECPLRRINAFCKLLDEKSTFDRDRGGRSAKLRKQVFRLAGVHHPLVRQADRLFESSETEVKHEIAKMIGKTWGEIERELFADIIQFHRLAEFKGYEHGEEFLARYNVAQSQAVLYDATSMTVWAGDDFKTILRYAKLARLMHSIGRQPDGSYVFRFDGPASVLRQSRRYGVAFAKFLPSLLACRDWRMQATIQHRRSSWENMFRVSPADGLNSNHLDPSEFDSVLEEDFARRWGTDSRAGWTMIREGEILHVNQKVFVPDFAFQHESGFRVVLEIVGFWTPEYLSAKIETLNHFRDHHILLAVSDSIDWPENRSPVNFEVAEVSAIIRYKTRISIGEVLARLDHLGKCFS